MGIRDNLSNISNYYHGLKGTIIHFLMWERRLYTALELVETGLMKN